MQNAFKKPLTKEEEAHYLKRFKEGDAEAKNVLIEHNLRLVAHIVKKYTSPQRDTDDLISIGTIGLIKAVNGFEESKGRLVTFASKCIENELLMMLRGEKKYAKEISLQEPIGRDREGNEISLIDVLEHDVDGKEVIDSIELKNNIILLYDKIKTVLTDREKQVIELRYGLYNKEEVTQREIAKILGISRSYVSRIEKAALNKLLIELGK